MTKIIKPLLADEAVFEKIQYPVLATPKLDGIRCLIVDGIPMSRKMKPIPNEFVREQLGPELNGLDGELMIQGDYNSVQSAIMSHNGEPDFTFHVFDDYTARGGYKERLDHISFVDHPRVEPLLPVEIEDEVELKAYLADCLALGFEGAMIRKPDGIYKHGRSTVNQGILLKLKEFYDDEATLVSFVEKMHNENPLEEDELGYAKRSSCKENLVPAGTAGGVIVDWNGIEFHLGFGKGITDKIKQGFWNDRENLIGKLVKFRYQNLSKDGVPRFGKMLGFRHEDDL